MDTRRIILFSFVLALMLVQGTESTSLISPSMKGFVTQLEDSYSETSSDELLDHREDDGIAAMAVYPEFFSQYKNFPLVATDSSLFGSKVLYSDGDIGRVLNNFTSNPGLYFWDVGIINGEFDAGDVIYYHINGNTSNIEQNDIRLTQLGNHFPGSKVTAYDIDFNKALKRFSGDHGINFVDQYGASGYDLMDPVYFLQNGSEIIRMDLRLSYFAYGPPGTLVNGHDLDQGLTTSNLPGCKLRFYNINGNVRTNGEAIYDEMDPVYLDVSGIDPGFVLVNDVRLS